MLFDLLPGVRLAAYMGCVFVSLLLLHLLLLLLLWYSECLVPHDPSKSCDLLSVAVYRSPFKQQSPALAGVVGLYLALCGLYWGWSAIRLVLEVRDVLEVKHFVNNKLGISDRRVRERRRLCHDLIHLGLCWFLLGWWLARRRLLSRG
jgi:hypothetical protein